MQKQELVQQKFRMDLQKKLSLAKEQTELLQKKVQLLSDAADDTSVRAEVCVCSCLDILCRIYAPRTYHPHVLLSICSKPHRISTKYETIQVPVLVKLFVFQFCCDQAFLFCFAPFMLHHYFVFVRTNQTEDALRKQAASDKQQIAALEQELFM